MLCLDAVCFADASNVACRLDLVAVNMGWLDVIVAVVAGKFPRDDVFHFPCFANLDWHVAKVAFAAVEREKPDALTLGEVFPAHDFWPKLSLAPWPRSISIRQIAAGSTRFFPCIFIHPRQALSRFLM